METPTNTSSIPANTDTQPQETAMGSNEPQKRTFTAPPKTLAGWVTRYPIRGDFNDGARIQIEEWAEDDYRVVITDLSSGLVIYAMDVPKGAIIATIKKYYVPYKIDVYRKGELDRPVFTTFNDLKDKEVLLEFPIGALGDTIAWFSYAERFQKKHGCRLKLAMQTELADLFRKQYPEMEFITHEDAAKEMPYATYRLGLYFKGDIDHQPVDFRKTGLHHAIGYQLGLDEEIGDEPPRVDLSAERKIAEKYVVIATKGSSQAKLWNNPQGWREVIAALKDNGYRVLCIDKERETGAGIIWNAMPYGAEDFTGNRPLQERIDLIKDADAFIGLSSGLSWLAWCCRVPIVMISGFTEPFNEFKCHRVQNRHVCHGCWNDTRAEFDHGDYLWCPFQEGNARFECTRAITSQMVLEKVKEALEEK